MLEVGKLYKNKRTNDLYAIESFARAAWDVDQYLIVYRKIDGDQTVWVRSATEFREKFVHED
jgi:hypothetical protein